jgi:phage shock protein C
MSRDSWHLDYGPFRGLYRDRESGWIFGVCAGLAERFDVNTATVRVITVVCLLLFFWPTMLVYIGATLLLKEKPLIYAGRSREYEFWRSSRGGDHWRRS